LLRNCLFWAALAGHEDADALDHLCGRGGAFGEEDVGAKRAVKGVDGSGDDHGGKAGVKLLGAADEFVAVHLRHYEITEDEVEGTGKQAFQQLQGFV